MLHRPPSRTTSLLLALAALFLLAGCATPPYGEPKRPSSAFVAWQETSQGRQIQELLDRHPGKSGLYVLRSGLDAFVARMHLIEQAERAVDLQYYILHDDVTGRFILSSLLAAADRGVRVRILVDDLGSLGIDRVLAAAEGHENIEARLFNPLARSPLGGLAKVGDLLARAAQLNRRMHNKMLTVDGVAAVVGGRNLGDEYFDASPGANFADLDLFAIGPVLESLGNSFDRYWNSPFVVDVAGWGGLESDPASLAALRDELAAHVQEHAQSAYANRVRQTRLVQELEAGEVPLLWAPVHMVADLPRKIVARGDEIPETLLIRRLAPFLGEASEELLLVSPYFVPRDSGVDYFTAAVERGARVQILTNSLVANDVPAVHSAYAPYRRPLLEGGVSLFEMRHTGEVFSQAERAGLFGSSQAALHAKTFVIDRRYVFVGSLNLDPRSVDLNTELGLLVDSEELAERQARSFERATAPEISWTVSLDDEGRLRWAGLPGEEWSRDPESSWWARFKLGLLGLLPIEGQL
ncbi:MAG: phospholipase D family protein [Myxococcota bacterium]|nr:phospholipase D family protein [Myxococcota bacterium]